MPAPKKEGTNVPVPEWLKRNSELIRQANGLYDAINFNWLKIEEAIVKSGVLKPTHIDTIVDPNDVRHFIGVDKVQGKWRIVYDTFDEASDDDPERFNWKPIVDCHLWVRQSHLKYAPELVKAIFESNAQVVSELAKSVKESQDFLKSIGIAEDEDLI